MAPWAIVFVFWLLGSCRHGLAPQIRSHEKLAFVPLAPLNAALHMRAQGFSQLKVQARITAFGEFGRIKTGTQIALWRPDRWVATAFSPHGPALARSVSDGLAINFWHGLNNTCETLSMHDVTQLLLRLGLDCSAKDLVDVFVGDPTLMGEANALDDEMLQVVATWKKQTSQWQAHLHRSDISAPYVLTRIEVSMDNAAYLVIRYSTPKPVQALQNLFIEGRWPGEKTPFAAEIRIEDAAYTPVWPEGLFVGRCPQNSGPR